MLITFIIWIVAFIFSIIAGILIQSFGINKHNDSFLFTFLLGFCFLVVYSQIYSLFFPIKSCVSLGVLLLIYLIIFIINKKSIKYIVKNIFTKNTFKPKEIICIVLVSLISLFYILLMTSQKSADFDDYLYHCQAVRWIEELGTVKGSGLINSRVSFNSSLFAVYALFGFRDIFGEATHTIIGFVAFISLLGLLIEVFRKKNKYTLCILGLDIYYIICVRTSLNTLGSDVIPNLLICCIAELWLNEDNTYLRADLCMLVFIAITMKLSFAVLGIISIFPIIELLKNKKYKQILFYFICGLVVTLPYLIRNYFISGWLLYPLTVIDIFNVEWKVPTKWAQEQADWVYAWARRGMTDGIEAANFAFSEWFPLWWKWFAYRNIKIILISSALLSVLWFIYLIIKLIKKKNINFPFLSLVVSLVCENLYWLITAPAVRFSFIPIYLLPILLVISIPFVDKLISAVLKKELVYIIGICLMMCYFMLRFTIDDCEYLFIKPETFMEMDADEYKMSENITLYTPSGKYDWAVGADYFPGGEYIENIMQIEPIGKTIKEGFRIKK